MRITVIGAGNIGTLMAAEMASRNHTVTVYTKRANEWSSSIDVYDRDDKYLMTGSIHLVTDSLEEAVEGAELIWITVPSFMFKSVAGELLPLLGEKRPMIGIVPGSGGAEFAFKALIDCGCILFGLQRVHSIARLKKYGKSVHMLGKKDELFVASIPSSEVKNVCEAVVDLLGIPCVELTNYLSVTLTPSNPILHTTRLFSMFKDYASGVTYSRSILFYDEWTDHSSQTLFACDKELQELCNLIPLELSAVKSLCVYYESDTPQKLTKKIQSIAAFKGLTSPMKEISGGWVPDLDSRYFVADFSYGLKVIKEIAAVFGMPTPNIDMVWNWYKSCNPNNGVNSFELGITKEEFLNLYI